MLSELCRVCVHRRVATGLNLPTVSLTSAEQQKAMAGRRAELRARQILEQSIVDHESTASLKFRPIDHDWCAAQSEPASGQFWFCEWLIEPSCQWFQGPGENELAHTKETGISPGGTLDAHPPALVPQVPATVGLPAKVAAWRLPLGAEARIEPVLRTMGNDLELDYRVAPSQEQLALSGEGLKQTILIFGGPGAGKTVLFKYLMERLLSHPDRPGALILDPKGVLSDWLIKACEAVNRRHELLIISGAQDESFNVLGNFLPPESLGRLLADVILADSPDVDQGWAVLLIDLLQSSCRILAHEDQRVTAKKLLEEILFQARYTARDGTRVNLYPIQRRARLALDSAKRRTVPPSVVRAYMRVSDYFASTDEKQKRFIRQIIEASLGDLATDDWAHLSDHSNEMDPYEEILQGKRIVLASTGQGSPAFQRSLSTLMKALYQQRALLSLNDANRPEVSRLSILACDEYAQVVTEGSSGLVSDARFFSLAREAGCMNLFALQSIATARSRFPQHMRDRWEGILGNVGIRFFMGLNDMETAQLASSLAGERDRALRISSSSHSAGGTTVSDNNNLVKAKLVPEWYLTTRMPTGAAMVQGKLDGRSAPTLAFLTVPKG